MGVCLSLLACRQPQVGERIAGATADAGIRIVLENAGLDLHGHVVATFVATEADVPLATDEVMALGPCFTLATLEVHPVDRFPAWKSHLLTGAQVAASLPPGGPGTPDPDVVTSAWQPGYEAPASLVDLGGGRFRYVFANPLTDFDQDDVVRVGVWLAKAKEPTEWTSSTIDFRPSTGLVEPAEERVLDRNCRTCHRLVESASGATGVRICVTCHTWQHFDPDTIDPAALYTTVTPALRDPNPLEFARMIHRIHRGKDLPTIHKSTWDGVSPAAVPSPGGLPLPFLPNRPGAARSVPFPWRKYSIVGRDGHERIFAQAQLLTPVDPTVATTQVLASGGTFPRDLRDCAVCHGDAARREVTTSHVSRRTCSGCHPDVWFQASSPAADPVRLPHAGGPQADDSQCCDCHVTGTRTPFVPIEEVHVVPARARRYNQPYAEIVRVDHLKGGEKPIVTFRLWDRDGPIAPRPIAPVPPYEPEGLATYAGLDPAGMNTSYVPRKFLANASIVIKIIGPTVPDYSQFSSVQLLSGTAGGNEDPANLTTSSGTDEYVYTFGSTVPLGTTGTFIVGMEVRRNLVPPGSSPPQWYDKTNNVFFWPYTGETVNESAENVYVYVSSASGRWPPLAGDPPAVPRRTVVELQNCLRCHDRIEFHGGARHDVAWCVTCHTYDNSDIDKRYTVAGRLASGGPVKIGATYDGVEERSTHFKMMIHRIHTGSRTGYSSLEGIQPFAIYYSKAYFFDRGGFPGDLRNCTLCHSGKSYLIESIPPDARATIANEHSTLWHTTGSEAHTAGEPSLLPIQAACTGCHATGRTFAHVAEKTVDGVETCAQCHEKGRDSVEVAHGLAPLTGGVASSFSAILSGIFVPQCASCHAAGGTPPQLDGSAAYDSLLHDASTQSGLPFVTPGAPQESYLVYKLQRDMPPGALLAPADLAAVEEWIANGAPND